MHPHYVQAARCLEAVTRLSQSSPKSHDRAHQAEASDSSSCPLQSSTIAQKPPSDLKLCTESQARCSRLFEMIQNRIKNLLAEETRSDPRAFAGASAALSALCCLIQSRTYSRQFELQGPSGQLGWASEEHQFESQATCPTEDQLLPASSRLVLDLANFLCSDVAFLQQSDQLLCRAAAAVVNIVPCSSSGQQEHDEGGGELRNESIHSAGLQPIELAAQRLLTAASSRLLHASKTPRLSSPDSQRALISSMCRLGVQMLGAERFVPQLPGSFSGNEGFSFATHALTPTSPSLATEIREKPIRSFSWRHLFLITSLLAEWPRVTADLCCACSPLPGLHWHRCQQNLSRIRRQ